MAAIDVKASAAKKTPEIGAGLRALDLVRPLVLLAAFVAVDRYFGWMWSIPFAFASVLAASVLVHDLIHNALAFPNRANDWRLALAQQYPAALVDIDWSRAEVPSSEVSAARVYAIAGGSGADPGPSGGIPQEGARALAWSATRGRWFSIASNSAGGRAPSSLMWSSVDGHAARGLIDGADRAVIVVTPAAPAATARGGSELALDFVELRFDYLHP